MPSIATRPMALQCRANSGVGIGLYVQPMIDCLIRPLRMRKSGSTDAAAFTICGLLRAAALAATAALWSQERRLSFEASCSIGIIILKLLHPANSSAMESGCVNCAWQGREGLPFSAGLREYECA